MNTLALMLCLVSSITIIILMRIAVNTQKKDWYLNLNKELRGDISTEIKEFWRVSIKNISVNVACAILLFAFIKDEPNFIISAVTYFSLGYSIVAVLIIIYAFTKFNSNVKRLKE